MSNKQTKYRKKVENAGFRGTIIYILIPVVVIIGFFIFKFYSDISTRNNSYSQIEYINSFMRNGKLNDYANKIGMKDWETDIKWFYDKDKGVVKIDYGYMKMTFKIKEFQTDRCQQALGTIGITSKVVKLDNGTLKLKLYYHDQELERWIS